MYAERAGYDSALWHPTCFVCSECEQGLVDLVYFWSNQKLLCGRHYCQTVWPRCSGCDEVRHRIAYHTILGYITYTAHLCESWPENDTYCLFCAPSADLLPVFSYSERWTDISSSSSLLLEVRTKPGNTLSALRHTHSLTQHSVHFKEVSALLRKGATESSKNMITVKIINTDCSWFPCCIAFKQKKQVKK